MSPLPALVSDAGPAAEDNDDGLSELANSVAALVSDAGPTAEGNDDGLFELARGVAALVSDAGTTAGGNDDGLVELAISVAAGGGGSAGGGSTGGCGGSGGGGGVCTGGGGGETFEAIGIAAVRGGTACRQHASQSSGSVLGAKTTVLSPEQLLESVTGSNEQCGVARSVFTSIDFTASCFMQLSKNAASRLGCALQSNHDSSKVRTAAWDNTSIAPCKLPLQLFSITPVLFFPCAAM